MVGAKNYKLTYIYNNNNLGSESLHQNNILMKHEFRLFKRETSLNLLKFNSHILRYFQPLSPSKLMDCLRPKPKSTQKSQ